MSAPDQASGSAQEAPNANPEQYQGLLPGSYTDLKLVGQSDPYKADVRSKTDQYTMSSGMLPPVICI